MKTIAELKKIKGLKVGYFARDRMVVYDPSVQPDAPELMLIYSVHGHQMCLRHREEDDPKITYNASTPNIELALQQYCKWLSKNWMSIIPLQNSRVISRYPMKKVTCDICDGIGTWMDRVNKCSYGVTQEESNIIEKCPKCRGAGFVDDLL